MKALTPAPLTYGAALPAYFATPSCRSASNHVGCLIIAFHHASVISVFRTSPWNRWLVAAPRRIEFVILRTDTSPRVALHPASRRRSYLRLRSCGFLRHGLSPCWCGALTGARFPLKTCGNDGLRKGNIKLCVLWLCGQSFLFSSTCGARRTRL